MLKNKYEKIYRESNIGLSLFCYINVNKSKNNNP